MEISAIAHATEDPLKVESAMLFLVPENMRQKSKFTRRYLEGHHGNKIVTIAARFPDAKDIKQVAVRIGELLPDADKRLFGKSLPSHTDGEGNLYIRFDKQHAFVGELSLEQVDPIRVKFKFAAHRQVHETIDRFLHDAGITA
jgi:RNA binding exosome subunit